MKVEIPLRIVVENPPAGVAMQVQRGKDALLAPVSKSKDALTFDFTVRVAESSGSGAPNFLGEFAQGPKGGRFVYVNSGKRAGQHDVFWDRRAKITLQAITAAQVKMVLASPGARLEARIEGTGRDGGPCCATVPLLEGGWRIVAR